MRTSKTTTAAPAEAMKRANFFLPKPVLDALEKVSSAEGLTKAEHVRRALTGYLKRHKALA